MSFFLNSLLESGILYISISISTPVSISIYIITLNVQIGHLNKFEIKIIKTNKIF